MQLDVAVHVPKEDAFIVVVDRHAQGDLGPFLADNVIIEHLPDLGGLREVVELDVLKALAKAEKGVVLLAHHAHAQPDAVITDIRAVSCNQPVNLVLRPSAEGAARRFGAVCSYSRHNAPFVSA